MNNTGQQKMQREMKKKSRSGKVYNITNPHIKAERGLIGAEQDVLKSLFTEDGKEPLQFHKLNSIQKKVLRKMKYPKEPFLIAIKLKKV